MTGSPDQPFLDSICTCKLPALRQPATSSFYVKSWTPSTCSLQEHRATHYPRSLCRLSLNPVHSLSLQFFPNPTQVLDRDIHKAMLQQLTLAAIVFQAATISLTSGHGNIIEPKCIGDSDHPYYIGGPAGTIEMAEIVGDASYGDYSNAVDDWFTKNKIATLKEYITTYATDIDKCGNTDMAGTPQPVPSDGYVQHDTLGTSHPGPCEIWCDDTRVFHDSNCAAKYANQAPTKLPIDVSVCSSSSEFIFYWLALHAQPWQVYINCAPLDGTKAASSGSTNSTTPATTTRPSTTTTTAPVAQSTDASTDEASDEEESTDEEESSDASVDGEASDEAESPATTVPPTTAPAPVTSSPSTSSSKCLRRRY